MSDLDVMNGLLTLAKGVKDKDKRELLETMLQFIYHTLQYATDMAYCTYWLEQEVVKEEIRYVCVMQRTSVLSVFHSSQADFADMYNELQKGDGDPNIPVSLVLRIHSKLYIKATLDMARFLGTMLSHDPSYAHLYTRAQNCFLGYNNIMNYWNKLPIPGYTNSNTGTTAEGQDQDQSLENIKRSMLIATIKDEMLPAWQQQLDSFNKALFEELTLCEPIRNDFLQHYELPDTTDIDKPQNFIKFLQWLQIKLIKPTQE